MRKFILAVFAVLLTSVSAFGQSSPNVLASGGGEEEVATPKAEVFAGYSYLRLYGENANGGQGAVTVNVNRWFGLTADVSGYHAQDNGGNTGFIAGGPRFTYRRGAITPFAHFLFGGSFGNGNSEGTAILGGGIDAKVSKHIAIRVFQADYIATTFRSNNGRISAGIVFRIGEK